MAAVSVANFLSFSLAVAQQDNVTHRGSFVKFKNQTGNNKFCLPTDPDDL